jgi:hypothetical protein
MTTGFDAVPLDANGVPLWSANEREEYWRYVDWLADYLYRPEDFPGEPLPYDTAALEVIRVEIEIASIIWNDPYADYPPEDQLPLGTPPYSDFLHREALARTLSRVPDRMERLKLLDRFFSELFIDGQK